MDEFDEKPAVLGGEFVFSCFNSQLKREVGLYCTLNLTINRTCEGGLDVER